MTSNNYIQRTFSEDQIIKFISSPHPTASMCFLRGRRRIGKSTLLNHIKKNTVFYYSGFEDESDMHSRVRWSELWSAFHPQSNLSDFNKHKLTWKKIFDELILYLQSQNQIFCLCLDEIQWITKNKSGFLGQLKDSWLKLEHFKHLKIIISGSSYKFFHLKTGGEEQILRGICTHNDIWLKDFTLNEIHQQYVPKWTYENILSTYLMIGGVPYYWKQIDPELNFIQAINKSLFSSQTYALKETNEILKLEFNSGGIKNVINFLAAIGPVASDLASIEKKTNIAHATAHLILGKLLDYNLLFNVNNFSPSKNRFYIKDPFLFMYFNLLNKMKRKILQNKNNDLIFSELFNSEKESTIPNFSGYAFERLVINLLENSQERKEVFFKKLHIENCDFDLGTILEPHRQIDIVLRNTTDRVDRFIECRFTTNSQSILNLIEELPKKLSPKERAELFIVTNLKSNRILKAKALSFGVTLITIEDLF